MPAGRFSSSLNGATKSGDKTARDTNHASLSRGPCSGPRVPAAGCSPDGPALPAERAGLTEPGLPGRPAVGVVTSGRKWRQLLSGLPPALRAILCLPGSQLVPVWFWALAEWLRAGLQNQYEEGSIPSRPSIKYLVGMVRGPVAQLDRAEDF